MGSSNMILHHKQETAVIQPVYFEVREQFVWNLLLIEYKSTGEDAQNVAVLLVGRISN